MLGIGHSSQKAMDYILIESVKQSHKGIFNYNSNYIPILLDYQYFYTSECK